MEFSEEKALGREVVVKAVDTGASFEEHEGIISNGDSMIKRFRIFSLPNCDKCLAAKEYLSEKVDGEVIDLGRVERVQNCL